MIDTFYCIDHFFNHTIPSFSDFVSGKFLCSGGYTRFIKAKHRCVLDVANLIKGGVIDDGEIGIIISS